MLEPGSAAWIVSIKWLQNYHKFILFDQFNNGLNESQIKMADDHFESAHPGPISNLQDLIENDTQFQNLYGTNTLTDLKSEYIDTYLDTKHNANYDFKIFNQELWEFLSKKYGGLEIKRYYTRNSYNCSVEAKLRALRLQIVNTKCII